MAQLYDYLIIGAGILGASLGAEISRRKPTARILIAEKEATHAFHQTGRNSGVVHSGVYYKPGTLKAQFCREGLEETRSFCAKHAIGYDPRGKLIVATNDLEESRLANLEQRAQENGVIVESHDQKGVARLEPNVNGIAALHIPSTAIVDYKGVTGQLLRDVENAGGEIRFLSAVSSVERIGDAYRAKVGSEFVEVGQIVACSGLSSDRVAKMLGIDPGVRILPFRGEYFVLPEALNDIVHRMIYPVPDPDLPFLGVHLTPMIDGTITVGPNAVLSMAREKYGHLSVDLRDARDALLYPGLWRLLAKHPKASLHEGWASVYKPGYLKLIQKYASSIKLSDLKVYRSANRAQAVQADGTLVDDFLIKTDGGLTSILNAPSPAATSAMPIARFIADKVV